jgi:NitT/TauT family transport system substrate-binding protein
MTVSWHGQPEDDDYLDGQLHAIDKRLVEMFAADVGNPVQLERFFDLIDRQEDSEREQARQDTYFRNSIGGDGETTRLVSGDTEPLPVIRTRRAVHLPGPVGVGAIAIALGMIALVAFVLVSGFRAAPGPEAKLAIADGLEKPDLKISIMKTTDLSPFWLAVKEGYFRDAGFTFDPQRDVTIAKSGPESVDKLAAKQVDIAYSSYPAFFLAKSNGKDIKLVADASSAGPNSCMVVAGLSSKVRTIKDVEHARVAVTARNTISDLMVMSTLKTNGIDYKSIEWVQTPFPSMATKLASGEIDAAFLTEPYLIQAQLTVGAVPVFDAATGPTANLPTAGFGADAEFVRKYPKTLAAFQKVMERATIEAKADRSKVEELLQEFADIDAKSAKLATLLTFQSSLEATRIQRVADLMTEFGVLTTRMDVSQMIARSPDSR